MSVKRGLTGLSSVIMSVGFQRKLNNLYDNQHQTMMLQLDRHRLSEFG